MKIKDLLEDERPQEKLIKHGPSGLSIVELLAIILRIGSRNNNVIDLSRKIISEFDFSQISRKSYEELLKFDGISKVKSCQIVSIFEIARRVNELKQNKNKIQIQSADDLYSQIEYDYLNLDIEKVMIVLVNSKNQIIRKEFIFEGTVNYSFVEIRKILKKVFDYNASGFFLIHNHPSGNSQPSRDDIELTQKISKICKNLEIRFLDHIIIGNEIYSFFESEIGI